MLYIALYTLKKTSNFEIHSWFHCQDIQSQSLQIPVHFQWRGAMDPQLTLIGGIGTS